MDIKIALQKIANEFVADKDYVHDPDHKHRPKGGNWKETPNGWSTKDKKEKTKPELKPDGSKKILPTLPTTFPVVKKNFPAAAEIQNQYTELKKDPDYLTAITKMNDPSEFPMKTTAEYIEAGQYKWTAKEALAFAKVKESAAEYFKNINQPKAAVTMQQQADAAKAYAAKVAEPAKEVSKPEPKLDDYMALIDTPAIKSIKKRINVSPDKVLNDIMAKTGKVKEVYKPHLIKLYKSWIAMREENPSPDMQAKIGKAKLAIQALRTPKFKKTTPRLVGGMKYLIQDNNIGADELQELAGFKESIKDHPRMSDKEYKNRIETGMKLPRNEQQLKQAFVAHMNPTNYDSIDAFNAAKQRVSKMNIQDFGKLLASLNNDEEVI